MAQGIVSINNEKIYCSKCGKTMAPVQFYTYKDGSKCELCKACVTMHINNYEPDTYLWLLEKFDVPYVERIWKDILDKAYQKDPYKITGMSVFGKYLSQMKLKQWKEYGWADTELIKAKEEKNAKERGLPEDIRKQKMEEMREAYEKGEITEAQWQTYQQVETPKPEPSAQPPGDNSYPINGDFEQVDMPDVRDNLTEEDKIYLATKWGRLYKAEEWVALEQLYNEFMNSFDIQGAARIDTLKKICKTSLKMDEAIDCGDVDTYQKLSRVYDAMMKSAKFTEAQNKDGDSNEFDSVGSIVAFCEKEGGFIEDIEINAERDIVDTIIKDNREYLNTLIHNDTNLSQQIENFLKRKTIMEEMKLDRQKVKETGDESILDSNEEDYLEFYEEQQKDKDFDNELLAGSEVEGG